MFKYPWTNLHELNLGWLIERLQEGFTDECVFVRPEDFPDSENPLQAALDAAATDRKMVLLSAEYDIVETLRPAAGVVIIGINDTKLITHAEDLPGFCPITILEPEGSLFVYGVTFDGNRPAGASQSIIPSSLPPGEEDQFKCAPLVYIHNLADVTFQKCTFTHYDSNRSTSPQWSGLYSVVCCKNAQGIFFEDCKFFDDYRECVVLISCEIVRFDRCYFNMQGASGISYTEIGIFSSSYVTVKDCMLQKEAANSNSVINAMGDEITIEGCHIWALGSNFGIDYGNEVGAGFSASGLYIRNNYLNCHIAGKRDPGNNLFINHENVIIENNVIDVTGLTTQSAGLYLHADGGEHIIVTGNQFVGSMSSPIAQDIRLAYTNGIVDITDNLFEHYAIRVAAHGAGLTIKSNIFEDKAIYQGVAGGDGDLVLLACKCETDIGSAINGNTMGLHAVGCDLYNTTMPRTTVDASLSYVRNP